MFKRAAMSEIHAHPAAARYQASRKVRMPPTSGTIDESAKYQISMVDGIRISGCGRSGGLDVRRMKPKRAGAAANWSAATAKRAQPIGWTNRRASARSSIAGLALLAGAA